MPATYNMIGSKKEMRWFFNHAVFPLGIQEAYSFVMCCRHKKLTKEEQVSVGLTRKRAEFLQTEVLRRPKVHTGSQDTDEDKRAGFEDTNISFETFFRTIAHFNVDKRAYTTGEGLSIPQKTLVVLMYVNPADMIKAWDHVSAKVEDTKTSIIQATLGGKEPGPDMYSRYQTFPNIVDMFKHELAGAKGARYWMDFDIDVPQDFKAKKQDALHELFLSKYGQGNFIMIRTSGGYHILVKTKAIKSNPNDTRKAVTKMYEDAIANGEIERYFNDEGKEKFECGLNNSSIPGVPLPGTNQYGNLVEVVNKEDFKGVRSNHKVHRRKKTGSSNR